MSPGFLFSSEEEALARRTNQAGIERAPPSPADEERRSSAYLSLDGRGRIAAKAVIRSANL
jgi:hypothetical protein